MGFLDKTKELGGKAVDGGKKVGHGAVDLGKKGVHKVDDALTDKYCRDCKHYTATDAEKGNCAVAGVRMGSAQASTCPQKAFELKA